MAETDPDQAPPSAAMDWECAAMAAGAALAGWGLGRGKTAGLVAGLAAAAGAKFISQSRKQDVPTLTQPLPKPVPSPLQNVDNLHQLSPGNFLPNTPDPADEAQWQKLAMSLLEVVHAMATRPTAREGSAPSPVVSWFPESPSAPQRAVAQGPLVWEQREVPQSRSDAWGDTVWFGMQDLQQARDLVIDDTKIILEDQDDMPVSPISEIILPPERSAPPQLAELPADEVSLTPVSVEKVADLELVRVPVGPALASESEAREALMQALQADEMSDLNNPFSLTVVEPDVEEPGSAEPYSPLEPLPELTVVAEDPVIEQPITAEDIEQLLQPDPSIAVVNRREEPTVKPRTASLISSIVARSGMEVSLPEPRPMGVSPMAFAPHIIPADPNGACKPLEGEYSSSRRLVPVAPNKVKAPPRMWPKVLVALMMLLVGLLTTRHLMADSALLNLHPLMEWLNGHDAESQDSGKQVLPKAVSLKTADARA